MAKSKSSKSLFVIILLIAGALGAWYYFGRHQEARPVFTTTTAGKGDISQVITATGSLEPVTSIQVGSQVSGLVTEVLVDFNSPVKEGQLLAKIDPATYDQRLRQSEADLASSVANHTLVRLNTERTRALRKQNLVSQQELDQAEATLAQADAALLTKQAAVENAKVDLARCSIYAPVDGIVLDRQTDVGRTVAASLNAPVLFVIAADLTKMQINAAIAEADIGSVEIDQAVNFTVDAYPDRQFRGRVVQIRNSPTTQSNVVTYQTIIQVRNDGLKLKPGMTANVSVVVASRPDVLKIANSALRVRMPESLLPTAPAAAGEAKPAETVSRTGGDQNRRQQMMQLMQDAGFSPGSGPPSPEVRAKMAALAKERGIELPWGGADRGNSGSTTRKLYKLGGTAEKPLVEPVTVKLGITDGSSTEVLEGLAEGDVIITSALIPGADAGSSAPATNPFSGQRRRL
jgi:HlyD family secretion protein